MAGIVAGGMTVVRNMYDRGAWGIAWVQTFPDENSDLICGGSRGR